MLKKIQKHKKKSGFIFKVNKIEPINTISKKKLKLGAKVGFWLYVAEVTHTKSTGFAQSCLVPIVF